LAHFYSIDLNGSNLNYAYIYIYNYKLIELRYYFLSFISWRLSYGSETFCNSNVIASGSIIGPNYDILCVKNCLLSNQKVGSTVIKCVSFSNLNDWTYGAYTWQFTFPLSNDIEIDFSGSAWAALVVNGGNWEVKYTFSTLNRTDTGRVNSSPKALLAPMVVVRQGYQYGFNIPYIDSDTTDTIRCRWSLAAKSECAGICQSVPFGALESTCYFYLNATLALPGLYAAAIQIEDFATSTSTTALSSVY
jgi:hypothetical protein